MKIADVFFAAQLEDAGLQRAAGTAGDKAGKTMGASMSTSLKSVGALGLAAQAGAAGFDLLQGSMDNVFRIAQDSITAASDLAETQSKVGVVFGQSAKDIDAWGKGAATSLGLSQQAAEEAAGSLGNLFTGIGQTQAEAATMSKSVVQLASDLGSFNNIDPTVALDKLRSGLAGESEPLRSVGVFLTEAKVKAKAMAMGLGDAHGALTEGEKILARYQIILAETGNAQGDFAKTADGEANSQRRLNAELKDSEALLGKRLLPIQKKVTDAGIDFFTGLERVLVASDLTTDGLRAQADILMRVASILGPLGGLQRDQATSLYAAADAADASRDALNSFAGSSETARIRMIAADAAVNGLNVDLGVLPATAKTAAAEVGTFGAKVATSMIQSRDDISNAAQALVDEMKKPFLSDKKLQDILDGKGSVGKQLYAGLHSQRPNVREAAENLRADIEKAIAADIHVRILPEAGNPRYGKPQARALGGPVKARVPYIVGEHRPEVFFPDVSGWIAPSLVPPASASAAGGAAGGGPTFHTTINYPDPSRAPEDFGRALRRLGALGIGS